jgi:hypothetical protein
MTTEPTETALVEAMARGIWEAADEDYLDTDAPEDCAKIAQAALFAIKAQGFVVVPGWQDIASAPRDKYVWLLGTDGVKVSPMCWMIECDDDRYTGWCGATSIDGGMLYCDHVPLGFTPTHFMPLPASPLAGGE